MIDAAKIHSFLFHSYAICDNCVDSGNKVEEILGGKLNCETLEIEKTQPEFKDGDIVVAEEDNYYDKVIFIAPQRSRRKGWSFKGSPLQTVRCRLPFKRAS